MPISLPKQLDQLHIVQHPGAVDEIGLKAFVMILLNLVAGLEFSHRSLFTGKSKIDCNVVLDFKQKLK